MTCITISVFSLDLLCRPLGVVPPPDQNTSRPAVALEAARSEPSEDLPDEPLAATAVGGTAPASSRASARTLPPDPSPTRLIVGPTARSLERGEVYLDLNGLVGGPFLQVGITDRISIGTGTPVLIPGIRPGEAFLVTPKVKLFNGENTAAAVGFVYASGPDGHTTGIAYGVATRGTGDTAVTIGLALSPLGDARANGAPVVMLGGEKRVTRKVKLISENFLATRGGVVGGGVRFIERDVTLDLGVGVPLGSDLVIPMFRLARKF
jgi:hypothetical protein